MFSRAAARPNARNPMPGNPKILWADDEIDLLRPHILFLETRGYDVTSVTNGADAIGAADRVRYDVILLDEQMPGLGGIDILEELRQKAPETPVVMVTKSEEERLMEEALGGQISDYLTKPVNPSQILLTIKRLLDHNRLRTEKVSRDYLQSFNRITQALMNPLTHAEWIEVYRQLVHYDIELKGDEGARHILEDQYREANRAFGKFVEERYPAWIRAQPGEDRPALSHDVIPNYVVPNMHPGKPVVFLVIDCMRYDQWLELETLLYDLFDIEKEFYYSILPTATPYSRNAIFSGLLPASIATRYRETWESGEDDEHSRNRDEERFLRDLMKRMRLDPKIRYQKLVKSREGQEFARQTDAFLAQDLSAIVINFVDILAHSLSDSDVLKQIAPNERAYRALTRTWFEHSWLYQAFAEFARAECTMVVTTDHGAIRSLRSAKVHGDRNTSTALRYKYGRNVKCSEKHAIVVADPEIYGLPKNEAHTNYIIAKEDYYFVYPTNFHHYQNLYRDTMQHGGASLEEMILPVVTLRPKT